MTINIFLDTNIINRILDIDKEVPDNITYEEDRDFLRKILDISSKNKQIKLYVNPSVKIEIEKTKDAHRREKLLKIFEKHNFIPFNKTIFPFRFPATFVSNKEIKILEALCNKKKGREKDKKIIADSAFCEVIDVLLTTDREHLANGGIKIRHLKIFSPKELFDYLSNKESHS
jgi:hypothetical protein